MEKHNRRSALALTGSGIIAALGGRAATAAAPVELPVERVNRLADELSVALDAWMAELSEPMAQYGKRAHWIAHVSPASYSDYPVGFENVRARREVTPEERVRLAQAELIAATKALHPDMAEWRIIRPEDGDPDVFDMFMIVGHREAIR